jgi:predicted transport protein
MPLFQIKQQKLSPVEQLNFLAEKKLQGLIEANLEAVFNCRFVATEFPTGPQHAGRIDTLALSEDNNPVIIEYKKVESSELINQSLYYLAWIQDHRGDFEIAAQKALGQKVAIDWSDVRVICIAPNYKKYDLHAVQVMGANIELWTYRLYKNDSLFLEEILQRSYAQAAPTVVGKVKNPAMVAAGKKAAESRLTGQYTFEEHIDGKPEGIRDIAFAVQEFIGKLDTSIEEAPKKLYVAYRTTQNIVCMEIQKAKVYLYLKLDPAKHPGPKGISRDVSNVGHFGTGDLEITLKSLADFEVAKPLIDLAYRQVGS